jgi:uncharacterized protein
MRLDMNNRPYTIITGATGGLGTSFALESAQRGHNLLLVSLPGENLCSLAEFIQRDFPVTVKVLELDLAQSGSESKVLEAVRAENLDVFMLINNAGISQNAFFEATDVNHMRKMIELNCISYVSLTSALLPELKKQKRSYIINVSSLGGYYPLPRKSCYSATKGFVRQYSQALRMEVDRHGISVSILCPGPMTTNVTNYQLHRQLNWFTQRMMMHPQKVAELTLRKALRGKEIIIPGRLNRLLLTCSSIVPDYFRKKLLAYSMKQLQNGKS